ncbi:MAG: class I SAM-dependent methyltransferase [Bryobacterales bacterium]|nr:class I SAM-dependent methyltransferase [Bryobacterales bacterium]
MKAQTLSTKRAEVEWHNFASFGQPDRALAVYEEENRRRDGLLTKHRGFIGPLEPFLEIGAAAGHSSYMLANKFGARGFALDISADALRHGVHLMDAWGLQHAPVRVAGDAANLPFRDGSLQFVMAFQMLSQFTGMEQVFQEVHRVLAPGGVFFLAEEPLRRLLTLRLYRCPYRESMKPWERKLEEWGLLGYLVRDVIGAAQEEDFGIRQNHRMGLRHWHDLIHKYFAAAEYEIFVPERGWGERIVKRMAVRLDRYHSVWRAARLLGGTLAAFCKKAGTAPGLPLDGLESLLRCPDCHASFQRLEDATLACACGYGAGLEDGVYNLLPSKERTELYPGDREDVVDFSRPGHEKHLINGWSEVEGTFGNKYRWIAGRAAARLARVQDGPQRLRIRGHAHELFFQQGEAPRIEVKVNGRSACVWKPDRTGVFVLEADVSEAADLLVEISATPVWKCPPDDRDFTVTISMLRLIPREA